MMRDATRLRIQTQRRKPTVTAHPASGYSPFNVRFAGTLVFEGAKPLATTTV
jgi:hypothetical protein